MTAPQEALSSRPPRYVAPHPLAWPEAPEGVHAFLITVVPSDLNIRWRRRRLGELSDTQLAWVAETVAIEAERRKSRGQKEPS